MLEMGLLDYRMLIVDQKWIWHGVSYGHGCGQARTLRNQLREPDCNDKDQLRKDTCHDKCHLVYPGPFGMKIQGIRREFKKQLAEDKAQAGHGSGKRALTKALNQVLELEATKAVTASKAVNGKCWILHGNNCEGSKCCRTAQSICLQCGDIGCLRRLLTGVPPGGLHGWRLTRTQAASVGLCKEEGTGVVTFAPSCYTWCVSRK
jgi:hypothetical protein